MEKTIDTIKQETEKLLQKVGIDTQVEVSEEDGGYKVVIDTEENALLIGRHGDTLSSLEHILSLLVAKKLGEFKRLLIEVGDYRKSREEYLKNLAARLKEEVLSHNTERTIRGLKPWERRTVHLFFAEDPDVATESRGEGKERVLVVKKK